MKRGWLAGSVGVLMLSTGCATGGGGGGVDAFGLRGTSSWAQWRAHELRAGYLRPQSAWHVSSFSGLVDYRYVSSLSSALVAGAPEAIYTRAHDSRDPLPVNPQTGLSYKYGYGEATTK